MASAPSTVSRSPQGPTRAPGGPPLSRPTPDITVLTSRDDFLLELGHTLAGRAGLRPVDSIEQAVQSMAGSKRTQVLVIDARAVDDVRAATNSLQARLPRAVVVIFAEASAEKSVSAALKGAQVFAVLPSEIEPRKTLAVLEAALAEAAVKAAPTVRAAAPSAQAPTVGAHLSQAAPEPVEGLQSPRAEGRWTRSRKLPLTAAAAMVATAIAGGALWYFTRGIVAPAHGTAPASARAVPAAPGPAAPTAPTEPTESTAVAAGTAATDLPVQGRLDELLEKARLAMHERRYTEPAGDNALLYYRSAAAQEPRNGEALDGLSRVASVLAGRVEEALTAGHPDEAAIALATFKAASPNDSRTTSLEQRLYSAQISKALVDGNFERAVAAMRQAQQSGIVAPDQIARWRSDLSRREEESRVQHLASLIGDRIREGKLIEPDDSAKVYLEQLRSSAPSSPSTLRAVHDLSAAYLKKAREAAVARNSTEQDRWLNEARGLGVTNADISAFQHEIAGARQKAAQAAQADAERTLQLARSALRQGRLTEPAQESAAGYLSQLQSSDPANAALPELGRELAARLLERARAAVLAGKSGDADLAEAKRWGADPKDVLAVQQLSAPSPKRLDTAALVAKLKRLRASPPDYPQEALTKSITGAVTLEFIVNTSGEPSDVHVVEATPPGIFDQSAIAAVKRWRYAPMLVNGAAVEVPVKTRMRFELPSK